MQRVFEIEISDSQDWLLFTTRLQNWLTTCGSHWLPALETLWLTLLNEDGVARRFRIIGELLVPPTLVSLELFLPHEKIQLCLTRLNLQNVPICTLSVLPLASKVLKFGAKVQPGGDKLRQV